MKDNIGVELLRSNKVNAREKAFEIYDTKLKGFTLKIWFRKTVTSYQAAKRTLSRTDCRMAGRQELLSADIRYLHQRRPEIKQKRFFGL